MISGCHPEWLPENILTPLHILRHRVKYSHGLVIVTIRQVTQVIVSAQESSNLFF